MAWTAPKTFAVGETLTAAEMNTNVRDNTLALKNPPADETLVDAATEVTYATASTWADIDATNLIVTITTTGGDVMIGFAGPLTNDTVDEGVYLDVARDQGGAQVRFAGDDGITAITAAKAAYAENASFVIIWTGLAAGTWNFKMQWKVEVGTARFWRGQGGGAVKFHAQFWAREI